MMSYCRCHIPMGTEKVLRIFTKRSGQNFGRTQLCPRSHHNCNLQNWIHRCRKLERESTWRMLDSLIPSVHSDREVSTSAGLQLPMQVSDFKSWVKLHNLAIHCAFSILNSWVPAIHVFSSRSNGFIETQRGNILYWTAFPTYEFHGLFGLHEWMHTFKG